MPLPLTCPAEDELLRRALVEAADADPGIEAHLGQCAECRHRVAELRRIAGAIRASSHTRPSPSNACLDEVTLAELLQTASVARSESLEHLAQCGACRSKLAQLRAVLSDSEVQAELGKLRAAEPGGRRRHLLAGLGMVAAAAVLLLMVGRPRRLGEESEHRAPTITAAAAPVPLFPRGDIVGADTLRWSTVDGATRYRVTLFDAAGRVLSQRELADTLTSLPDSLPLLPGRSYLWKVEASTDWQRWASSPLVEFRITPSRRP